MDSNQLILTILGIIGLIFVIIIVYYFILRFMDYINYTDKPTKNWPPSNYMTTIGAQCPDYWVYDGKVGNGYHKCVNKYNIPVADEGPRPTMCFTTDEKTGVQSPFNCYDEKTDNTRSFKTLNRWPVRNRNSIKDRCLWRDCCGPNNNTPASWIGIDDKCGY